MPLFDTNAEKVRKQNLKNMEDKRVRFAEELDRMGFKPERMLFCSSEAGNFVAIAPWQGKTAVIVSPAFGGDGDFFIEMHDKLVYEKEDVFEKGTGLNGAFGFGTKGAKGYRLHITLKDGSITVLAVVAGRTSWLEVTKLKKNPLLSTKRRRGDANIVWDLMPIEPGNLGKITEAVEGYYLA